jgi:hypothetical protein
MAGEIEELVQAQAKEKAAADAVQGLVTKALKVLDSLRNWRKANFIWSDGNFGQLRQGLSDQEPIRLDTLPDQVRAIQQAIAQWSKADGAVTIARNRLRPEDRETLERAARQL